MELICWFLLEIWDGLRQKARRIGRCKDHGKLMVVKSVGAGVVVATCADCGKNVTKPWTL